MKFVVAPASIAEKLFIIGTSPCGSVGGATILTATCSRLSTLLFLFYYLFFVMVFVLSLFGIIVVFEYKTFLG